MAHVRLVVMALAAASAIALVLGALALRSRVLERLFLGGAGLVQAVPAIALLAVMVPVLAWFGHSMHLAVSGIGELPAFVALTLYALLPIVRGVVVGVRGIDASVLTAAAAVGMTDRERLLIVEAPLAAPSILSGLRTAAVWTVGMATLGTPVGATSLGNLIFGGLQTRQNDRVAVGCLAAAAIALALDGALALAERRSRSRRGDRTLALTLSVVFFGALASLATGVRAGTGDAPRPIRIGAKGFTEQIILAELLRCAAGPGVAVDVRPSLGSTVAFDALRAGDLDVYVEYTGTAWTTILGPTTPTDRKTMQADVARELARDRGVTVLASLGFENAYTLVVRANAPAHTIADLGSASDRAFGGDYEFFARPEWRAIRAAYGLAPRELRTMDPSLLYSALAAGAVDVIAGYTTDGRIESMGLRALEDPRGAIPPYDAIVLASSSAIASRPEIMNRFRALAGSVDAATMRRWNAAVDRGAAPRDVVRDHLACRREARGAVLP
jgi:osmoprotectant transport system permease protein